MEKLKFNDWEIINQTPIIRKRKKYYLCRCICGKEKLVDYYCMKTNGSKRCSSCAGKLITLPKGFTKSWEGKKVGELNATLYNHVHSKAKERNLEFNITQEFLWELLVKQNFKCKLSGVDIKISDKIKNGNPDFNFITASVDRIDSLKGYVEDNVQWVHKDVNKMKMQYSNDYFIEMCKKISITQDNTEPNITLNE